LLLAAALVAFVHGRGSAAEAPFYQGKTMTIIEGRAAGGTGSLRVQVAVKYLLKYLPGNPAVAYQYMAGGGGTAAANHLANAARRDGLTIGNIGTSVHSNAIFGAPGVHYKLDDFAFLGSPTAGNAYALVIRSGLNLDTVEKLKAYKGLRFGNRSVGHAMYIGDRLTAFILELQDPRWILGYNDQEINLALERGEADAKIAGIPGFVRENMNWLKQGFTVPVVVKNVKGQGAELTPTFPQNRPSLDQYADTELKRAVIRLHHSSRPGSSIFMAHRGIPEPALAALKEAFDKVWRDPQFAEEYLQLTKEPLDPITGEEMEEILRQMPRDPKVMDTYKLIIGGGPLPPAR
jgi:hypothetical protein